MPNFTTIMYSVLVLIATTIMLYNSKREELKRGKAYTYNTALKTFFYRGLLPFSLMLSTILIVLICFALLAGEDVGYGLYYLFKDSDTGPIALLIVFTLLALYFCSLLHCLRRYNFFTNIMYWVHIANLILMFITTLYCDITIP